MVRALPFVLVSLLASAALAAEEREMLIATLEWPPYVGAALPQQGLSARIVSEAAKAAGYRVRYRYYPWNRAVYLGQHDPSHVGYFPAYYTEERAKTCHFTASIGPSPVGFVERRDAPVAWTTLADLRAIPIGVVDGYANGQEFDQMVAQRQLMVDPGVSDQMNIQKVGNGRLRLAVIDTYVLDYLLATSAEAKPLAKRVQRNVRLLSELSLHICFKKNDAGRMLRDAVDQGLRQLDLARLTSEYFKQLK
ncbi:substrate-binding periplasmic protein [Chitinimonas lacunae]|uniref:Substrate-binding periplasmic protein n=1 Tax=Chitinimonas lacunae TaxID=1963018 RepID=A0ABV8MWG9_9NEIS